MRQKVKSLTAAVPKPQPQVVLRVFSTKPKHSVYKCTFCMNGFVFVDQNQENLAVADKIKAQLNQLKSPVSFNEKIISNTKLSSRTMASVQ